VAEAEQDQKATRRPGLADRVGDPLPGRLLLCHTRRVA
jgi:hypothetical protein